MRAICIDTQRAEHLIGIARTVEAVAVIDMKAFGRDLNAKVVVGDFTREVRHFGGAVGKRMALVQGQQGFVEMTRRHIVLARGEHHTSRAIDFAHHAHAVPADLGGQHTGDAQLRDHAHQQGVQAQRVGVGELRQITYAHQNVDVGVTFAQLCVTQQRSREAVMEGIEHRIGEERLAAGGAAVDSAMEIVHVAGMLGDQDRHAVRARHQIERAPGQAEHVVGAGRDTAFEFATVQRIDAYLVTQAMQRRDAVLEMRKGRGGQAADVDDVGAIGVIARGHRQDIVDRAVGRLHYLGKQRDVGAVDDARFGLRAEMCRQVLQFFRPARKGHTEMRRQLVEIAATAARQDDLVEALQRVQAALQHGSGQQGSDIDARHADFVAEVARLQRSQHARQALLGEMPGNEQQMLAHGAVRGS